MPDRRFRFGRPSYENNTGRVNSRSVFMALLRSEFFCCQLGYHVSVSDVRIIDIPDDYRPLFCRIIPISSLVHEWWHE